MDSISPILIQKALREFATNLAEEVAGQLFEKLAEADLKETREELLTDHQICERLQISTSHFYQLKRRFKKDFPVYDFGGAKRYKQSEVEQFFKNQADD